MRFFRRIGELKGWKRFGFEVGIIAIGLSITLIAQELITNASRARETRQAVDAVEVEFVQIWFFANERAASEPCRRAQFEALSERLQRADAHWTPDGLEQPSQSSDVYMLPSVFRTPLRPFPDMSWQALLTSNAATELDRAQFATLGNIFNIVAEMRGLQVEAWRLKGRLAHLSVAGPMSASERRTAYDAFGELAAIEALVAADAIDLGRAIATIDFRNERIFDPALSGLSAEEFEAALLAQIAGAQASFGACYDASQHQLLFDLYNRVTGSNLTIPPREVAP